MSKKAAKKVKDKEQSFRDKLNAGFVKAVEAKWQVKGDAVLDKMAEREPAKFAEMCARLVMTREEAKPEEEQRLESPEDCALFLLTEICERYSHVSGVIAQADIDDDMVSAAVEAYRTYTSTLERIVGVPQPTLQRRLAERSGNEDAKKLN